MGGRHVLGRRQVGEWVYHGVGVTEPLYVSVTKVEIHTHGHQPQ